MSTVAEIKSAIDSLSPQEYCELMALIHPFPDDDWDRQMKADAASGKFDAMISQAHEDYVAGKTIPLEEILKDGS